MLKYVDSPASLDTKRAKYPCPLVWAIDPLPDFLADPTLTGSTLSDRLQDVVSRWVQWISSLWAWQERALFALRFHAADGQISLTFEAQAKDEFDRCKLADELGVLLRAQRLNQGVPVDDRVYLDRARSMARPAVVEIRQYESHSLWTPHRHVANNGSFREELSWLSAADFDHPGVVFGWWGPGGPFLIPMESLASQPVPTELVIYLQPTRLLDEELRWLAAMAREAQSKGEQNIHAFGAGAAMRTADPVAQLAGRLYIANLRRLAAAPFLVSAVCAAAERRLDVAHSVASTMQSLVHETPCDQADQNNELLPSGAELLVANESRLDDVYWPRYPESSPFSASSVPRTLGRLPYLVDARGAALAFRLPLSVRGGVPGIRVRQLSPDFHPGPRLSALPAKHVGLGTFEVGGLASIPVRDLTKHVLITGFTGSGKTVTALQLLHQLWCDHHIPFLVLESAKQEYRGLCGVRAFQGELRVHTVGNESCLPLRLNPFELLPGVRVEAHVGKLQTCFEGSIPPIGPSSSVISEALLQVYEQFGWSLTDTCRLDVAPRRRFPTLTAFVAAVDSVLKARGYAGEVESNLRAALVGRFRPLLLGSKGRTFDSQHTYPRPTDLFSRPTILELNDLNVDDKALVVMFLLTMLREYRERHKSASGDLVHVTLVEEAHNILPNVGSQGSQEGVASADTRYKAVEAFCQLLTEIRALGEGIIVCDQSPEKLARDALRNTNLQIAHQLRDGHDRDAIANAMIMEDEQRDYLGKLSPGKAAVFYTGLEKATFVQVDQYYSPGDGTFPTDGAADYGLRGTGFRHGMEDAELLAVMNSFDPELWAIRRPQLPFEGCASCQSQCHHRDDVFPVVDTHECQTAFEKWLTGEYEDQRADHAAVSRALINVCRNDLRAASIEVNRHSAWCWLLHAWHRHGPRANGNPPEIGAGLYERFARFLEEELSQN